MQHGYVTLERISKSFVNNAKTLAVLEDVSFTMAQGEFICILGYSGCGKSTLLRLISALELPDSGGVFVGGVHHAVPNSDVMLMFQDFNQLFPWKTLYQNVLYPILATKSAPKAEAQEIALQLIEAVGLTEFRDNYPHTLSGGMKQRAAVARALAIHPKVLLMDEPFASLDAITRKNIQKLTREICSHYGVTTIFVTHSVEEAVLMADRIIVMNSNPGRIEEVLDNQFTKEFSKQSRRMMITTIMNLLDEQLL